MTSSTHQQAQGGIKSPSTTSSRPPTSEFLTTQQVINADMTGIGAVVDMSSYNVAYRQPRIQHQNEHLVPQQGRMPRSGPRAAENWTARNLLPTIPLSMNAGASAATSSGYISIDRPWQRSNRVADISNKSKSKSKSNIPPMERWTRETVREQPWNDIEGMLVGRMRNEDPVDVKKERNDDVAVEVGSYRSSQESGDKDSKLKRPRYHSRQVC